MIYCSTVLHQPPPRTLAIGSELPSLQACKPASLPPALSRELLKRATAVMT